VSIEARSKTLETRDKIKELTLAKALRAQRKEFRIKR
jgi:hypothetical protein